MSRRGWFALLLGVIAVVGLALRWGQVLVVRPTATGPDGGVAVCEGLGFADFDLCGDAVFYHGAGRALAEGDGFVEGALWLGLLGEPPQSVASAYHPPLFTMYLGAASVLGADTVTAHRLASGVLGVGAVTVIGLLGRRLAGERAGLLAAGIAAVYPQLWANDEMLLSESMYALTIAVVLLLAYRFHDDPTLRNAVLLGAAVGAAALTRSEGLLLFPLVVAPLAWMARSVPTRRRWQLAGASALVTALVVGPWVVHNLVRFEAPVLIASGYGSTLVQGNCDSVYSGELLGYHDVACFDGVRREAEESETEEYYRWYGLHYVKSHLDRAPIVAAARIGRVWDVFRPFQNAELNEHIEDRTRFESIAGLWAYWLLLVPAAYGLVVLARRRVTILPLVMMLALVTITAGLAYGLTRYRVPAEVAIAVAAGVGIDATIDRGRRTRDPATLHEPASPAGSV